jgi:hypothetical protein
VNVESLTFLVQLLPHILKLNRINDVPSPSCKIQFPQGFANFFIMLDEGADLVLGNG